MRSGVPFDGASACDVLVVGAGPSGAACATVLARAGFDVCLVDRQAFPREKVCGDALIPDAMDALEALGALDRVMQRARAVPSVLGVSPRGLRICLPATAAVLPRRELDALLVERATEAGARLWTPVRFEAPVSDPAGRVVGARLCGPDGESLEMRARWVVLATGAASGPLERSGVCLRRAPSGIALRGYVRHPDLAARMPSLQIVWHRAVRPGYGWVFPGPEGVFNVGVGVFHAGAPSGGGEASPDVNLRSVFDAFAAGYAPARELLAEGEWVGAVKGAPLRCSLAGAQASRPGLLVTGEAMGSTYSFTGEGIGKALQTGMDAAAALQAGRLQDAAVRADYDRRLALRRPRFELYEKANRINRHPWLTDLLFARARSSERLRRRMAGVLDETANPAALASWKLIPRLIRG